MIINKGGRPNQGLSEFIGFQATKAQKARIRQIADEHKVSQGAAIRMLLEKGFQQP